MLFPGGRIVRVGGRNFLIYTMMSLRRWGIVHRPYIVPLPPRRRYRRRYRWRWGKRRGKRYRARGRFRGYRGSRR